MKFCLSKFWKKSKFMIFASKFSEIFVELGPFSGQSFKICPKWLFYLGPNIILEKVRKFENIWIIPWEMAADLLSVGWIPPPPALIRVNDLASVKISSSCSFMFFFDKTVKIQHWTCYIIAKLLQNYEKIMFSHTK